MIKKIVSGGQTGADRAALDFALRHGIDHGGWCPRGRCAEDGTLSEAYVLRETPESAYSQRTAWNVRDSDGTAIFSLAPTLTGGSLLTAQLAEEFGKPWIHLCRHRDGARSVELLKEFLRNNRVQVLNVAGPRASNEPLVAAYVLSVLEQLLAEAGVTGGLRLDAAHSASSADGPVIY